MKLSNQGLILIIIPLVFQLAFITVLFGMLAKEEAAVNEHFRIAQMRVSTYKVLGFSTSCLAKASELTVVTEIKSDASRKKLERDMKGGLDRIQELKEAAGADREGIKEFENEYREYIDEINKLSKSTLFTESHDVKKKLMAFSSVRSKFKRLLNSANAIFQVRSDRAGKLLTDRNQVNADLNAWILTGVLLSIVVAAGVTIGFSTNFVKRIRHLKKNSHRLAAGQELLPSLCGSDELAELDNVFYRVATLFRESFTREKEMFDNAADIICCLNEKGEIERINGRFEETLGHKEADTIGHAISEFVHEGDRQSVVDFLQDVRIDAEQKGQLELRLDSVDGTVREYVLSVRWENSRRTHYCVFHDTTERKRMEQAKQDFVAMLSHDLRSPLSAVSITLDIAIDGKLEVLPENCREVLTLASRSTNRLVSLINEFLDLEKLEAGEMEVALAAVPLTRIVTTSIDAIQALANQKGVAIEYRPSDAVVIADEQRMSRVLINFLSNAINVSEKGTTVLIKAQETGGYTEVEVTDQGPGIPEEELDRLFDRYKQVINPAQNKRTGSGLGLTICKAIVKAHGGEVGVRSKVGVGSTFWFLIKSADKDHYELFRRGNDQ